jgi:hypothetical protein
MTTRPGTDSFLPRVVSRGASFLAQSGWRRPWSRAALVPALASVLALMAVSWERSRDVTGVSSASQPAMMAAYDADVDRGSAPAGDLRAGGAGASALAASAPSPARGAGGSSVRHSGAQASADPVDLVSYLAYAHTMSLELPTDRVTQTMAAHMAACSSAGLQTCQLVTSRQYGSPLGDQRGELSLRAEPRWLERFTRDVETGSRNAGGRVTGRATTTEDLTRAIVDTEAGLRARRTLRDRLEQLLATRKGELSDLLAVEGELARVQAEIDSTTSTLAAMRTRVVMSTLSLSYAPAPRVVAANTFEPLGFAIVSFVDAIVRSSAALVGLIGIALPWAIAASLGLWVVRSVRRGRSA